MIKGAFLAAAAVLASACSPANNSDEVPPLPEQTAESANALMAEAERASANAAARAETDAPSARSASETVNEGMP